MDEGGIENTENSTKKEGSSRRWICVSLVVFFCLAVAVAVAGGVAFYFMQHKLGEGLQVRPRNSNARINSQMFVLKQGDTNTHPSQREGEGDLNADYVARTTKFLETYSDTYMGSRMNDKTGEEETYPVFDPRAMLGECGTKQNHYGYVVPGRDYGERVEPCVFIELNPVLGWTPEPYDCEAEKNYYDSEACRHIKEEGADAVNNVYINCMGRYPADREALEGGLMYYPANRAFPIAYFPFKGKGAEAGGNYHAPLVAVKISPRAGHEGQLIHMECRAYYKGVKHNTETNEGILTFELQINSC